MGEQWLSEEGREAHVRKANKRVSFTPLAKPKKTPGAKIVYVRIYVYVFVYYVCVVMEDGKKTKNEQEEGQIGKPFCVHAHTDAYE